MQRHQADNLVGCPPQGLHQNVVYGFPAVHSSEIDHSKGRWVTWKAHPELFLALTSANPGTFCAIFSSDMSCCPSFGTGLLEYAALGKVLIDHICYYKVIIENLVDILNHFYIFFMLLL